MEKLILNWLVRLASFVIASLIVSVIMKFFGFEDYTIGLMAGAIGGAVMSAVSEIQKKP